jgi:hypothetical protein
VSVGDGRAGPGGEGAVKDTASRLSSSLRSQYRDFRREVGLPLLPVARDADLPSILRPRSEAASRSPFFNFAGLARLESAFGQFFFGEQFRCHPPAGSGQYAFNFRPGVIRTCKPIVDAAE